MARGDDMAKVTPLHAGARTASDALAAVGARVVEALPGHLPTMGDAYRREVAEYAAMEPDVFADVLETSESFVGRFVEDLRRGVDHPVPDHAGLLAAGRRRHEAGISLDAAMHAFRIASRVGWSAIADACLALDPVLVSELASRWIDYVDRAATAFAEGHQRAASDQLRRVDARRQALVADLLAADDEAMARAVGARHGLRLADWYVPVVVGTSEPFAAQDRCQPVLPPGTLVGQRSDHLMALVPLASAAGRLPSLAVLAGEGPVAHGRPARLGAPLVTEVARAESILAAALTVGRPGIHGPGSLLLQRVVREHDGLERHLADSVLAPLLAADGDGIFVATLRAYLATGAVRGVADDMFVHVNTVTYRLRRVRETTGLDPRVPQDAALLVMAMALLDVSAPATPDPPPGDDTDVPVAELGR